MEFEFVLSTERCIVFPDAVRGVLAASNHFTLLKPIGSEAGKMWQLNSGVVVANIIQPDDKHIAMIKQNLSDKAITFPYYTWT